MGGGGWRAALWLCPIVEDAAPHCCRRLRRREKNRGRKKKWQRCCRWGLLQVFCLPSKWGDALSCCLVYLLCFYSGLGAGLQVANRRHCLKKVGGGGGGGGENPIWWRGFPLVQAFPAFVSSCSLVDGQRKVFGAGCEISPTPFPLLVVPVNTNTCAVIEGRQGVC